MRTLFDQLFNNATARRDFRIQLRGNRAVVLFTVYLGILSLFAVISYDSGLARSTVNLVEAQSRLQSFYGTITGTLVFAVITIATSLGSFAVVMEKQRRSLELVFSAPVHPRYFLVGKLIGIYRFILLVLVLAAPVLATCIMLGGATWGEAFTGLWILSMHGLIFAAVGVVCSTLATKPTGALSLSLLVAILLTIFASAFGGTSIFFGLRGTRDVAFGTLFSPFTIFQVATSSSSLWGVQVQNWIPFTVVALMIVHMLLLGAESLLSGLATKTVRALRIAALFYSFLLPGLLWLTPSPSGKVLSHFFGFLGCLIVAMAVPTITAFGFDEVRKRRPNGWFRPKELLSGTPAGALPFLIALLGAAMVSVLLFPKLFSLSVSDVESTLPNLVLTFGFAIFLWGYGRAVSAGLTTIRSAKLLSTIVAIGLVALPALLLSTVDGQSFSEPAAVSWMLYPFRSIFGPDEQLPIGFFWGGVFAVGGAWLAFFGEKRLKANLQQPRFRLYVEDERA